MSSIVNPYCGQQQNQRINVPAMLSYKSIEREEGPWSMLSYQSLWPQPPEQGVFYGPMVVGPREAPTPLLGGPSQVLAFVPPPLSKTDLWSAQQTWPL